MAYYRVILEAKGIKVVDLCDGPPVIGFFTTRVVRAESVQAAEEVAKAMVLADWTHGEHASLNKGGVPRLRTEAVYARAGGSVSDSRTRGTRSSLKRRKVPNNPFNPIVAKTRLRVNGTFDCREGRMTDAIVCATCGRSHPVSDSELTFGLPDVVFGLSEDDKDARCKIGKEIVELDGARFFVRGLLPLEVSGREREYSLGVWAEVSRDVLDRIRELWSDPDQDQEPLMSAKLANKVPFHSDTVGLLLGIQLTGPKTRPRFFLDPVEHSLYIEQLCGIDEHRAIEYSDPESRRAAIEQVVAGDARNARA